MPILIVLLFVAVVGVGTAISQCPSVSLVGPSGLTSPGDAATIRVDLNGQVTSSLQYVWSVKGGKIINGGDRAEITVTVAEPIITVIEVSVSIKGLPGGCPASATDTFPFAPAGVDPILIDEFGKVNPNEVRSRLDTFFAELNSNPEQIGVVVLRLEPKERMDSNNHRLQFIFSHIKYRNFDRSRIWFQLDRSSPERTTTQLYRYPEDAADALVKMADPKTQLIIKGDDLR